ncbi:hypothetical protein [Sphingomonas sp. CCH5-D11]|jgi:phosphoglycerol transferase MdoB-like AlkP superfamily enzyme|uniref:hypothetical protein n=1 Tax=Sphingomonas sp. CCH5-D11 TaxID=1768786 RepID=UPI00083469E9|nr:hypothetical protein [Sphingomonas sp. CCH5-D11]
MFIIFALTALAGLCWLLFHLAALALPLVAGISAAMLAYESGAGLLGAGIVGFLVGVVTLSIGQVLFSQARSPVLRALTAAMFAAPAAVAGFSVAHRIMIAGDASDPWAVTFGIVGAVVTGGVAIAKVSALASDDTGGASLQAAATRGAAVGAHRPR